MTSGLLTAGSGHPWETEVVAALDRLGAPYTVLRRCADVADVLAIASTGQVSAAVLSADLRRLDSEAMRRLSAWGVAVVVVHPAGDPRAPERLGRIGVTTTVPDDAGSVAILGALAAATEAMSGATPPAGALSGSHPAPPSPDSGPDPSGPDPSWPLPPAPISGPPTGSAAEWLAGPTVGPPWFRRGPEPRPLPRPELVIADPAAALRSAGSASPTSPGAPSSRMPSGVPGVPAPGVPSGGDPRDPGRPGVAIAVWGPVGAPGRSTVAMGIADEAAAAGRTVMLIDADVYGGVLAAAFGLLDESPGLAGACRMASNGRLDGPALTGLCWSLGPRLSVLTGIARADRWPEVRPSAVPMVLAVARGLADVVVVDCAAILETDEEISFDTMAPRRNGATLAVLAEADVVLAVGAGDPPGIERLVRGLAQLAEAVPEASPRVVVNRVRRTAASRHEIGGAVGRFAGLDVLAYLPEDRDATDSAWRRCVGLSVAAPRSVLRTRLAALAHGVAPLGSATTGDPARPPDLGPPAGAVADEAAATAVGGARPGGRRHRGRHAGTAG